mmetsp:Transcript_90139/g.188477  ORF Transcript_90139/g.188477 Transcript_90139/m.188477 type:complete len:242 (-) Transcript_90139:707-1432(-)
MSRRNGAHSTYKLTPNMVTDLATQCCGVAIGRRPSAKQTPSPVLAHASGRLLLLMLAESSCAGLMEQYLLMVHANSIGWLTTKMATWNRRKQLLVMMKPATRSLWRSSTNSRSLCLPKPEPSRQRVLCLLAPDSLVKAATAQTNSRWMLRQMQGQRPMLQLLLLPLLKLRLQQQQQLLQQQQPIQLLLLRLRLRLLQTWRRTLLASEWRSASRKWLVTSSRRTTTSCMHPPSRRGPAQDSS